MVFSTMLRVLEQHYSRNTGGEKCTKKWCLIRYKKEKKKQDIVVEGKLTHSSLIRHMCLIHFVVLSDYFQYFIYKTILFLKGKKKKQPCLVYFFIGVLLTTFQLSRNR